MKARILLTPPISGTIEEVRFHAEGNCTWVLFEPESSEAWVGIFGNSASSMTNGGTAVAILDTPTLAYIVAAGKDYLIDYHTRELRLIYEGSLAHGVVAVPRLHRFIVWDDIRLQAVSDAGACLWTSRRVSWDGIRNVNWQDDSVAGEACDLGDNGWIPFKLDPMNGQFSGGSYVTGPWDTDDGNW